MTSPLDGVPFCCDADALIEFEKARLIQDLNVFAGLRRIRIPLGVYHEVCAYKGVSTALKDAVERWKNSDWSLISTRTPMPGGCCPKSKRATGSSSAWRRHVPWVVEKQSRPQCR